MRAELHSKLRVLKNGALSTEFEYVPTEEFDNPLAVESLRRNLTSSERHYESEYTTSIFDPVGRAYIESYGWGIGLETVAGHYHSHEINMRRNLFQKTLRGRLDDWLDYNNGAEEAVLSRYFGRRYALTSFSYDNPFYYFATFSVSCPVAPDPEHLLGLVREQTDIERLHNDILSGEFYGDIAEDMMATAKVTDIPFVNAARLVNNDDPAILRALCFRPDFHWRSTASLDAQFALLDNKHTPIDALVGIATSNASEEFQLRLSNHPEFAGVWEDAVLRWTVYPSVSETLVCKSLGIPLEACAA